jgi:hypothetical protein
MTTNNPSPFALARFAAACAVAVSAAVCTIAGASERGAPLDPAKAGIPVYPGAKEDAATSAFLRESLGMTGAAYRSGDGAAKVVAFYEKQAGMKKMPGATSEQAGFSAGCKGEFNRYMKKEIQTCAYQVTVQNPWMDMKTGQLVRDTLISIVKQ